MRLLAVATASLLTLCRAAAQDLPGGSLPRDRQKRIVTRLRPESRPPPGRRAKECERAPISLRILEPRGDNYDDREEAAVRDVRSGEILEFLPGRPDPQDAAVEVSGEVRRRMPGVQAAKNPKPRRMKSLLDADLALAGLIADYYNRGCTLGGLTVSAHGSAERTDVFDPRTAGDLLDLDLSEAFAPGAVVRLDSCNIGDRTPGVLLAERLGEVFLKKRGGTIFLPLGKYINNVKLSLPDGPEKGWLKYAVPAGGGPGAFQPDLPLAIERWLMGRKKDYLGSHAAVESFWTKCEPSLERRFPSALARSRPEQEAKRASARAAREQVLAVASGDRSAAALARAEELLGAYGGKMQGSAWLALFAFKSVIFPPCEKVFAAQNLEEAERRKGRAEAPQRGGLPE